MTDSNVQKYSFCAAPYGVGDFVKYEDYMALEQELFEKTKQCEQLAAENAALKSAIQTHSESTHFCEVCGKDDPCSTDDVCYAIKETPATDAFLREVRAQGVEMLAKRRRAAAEIARNNNDETAWASLEFEATQADEFAAALRQGGAVGINLETGGEA